MFFGDFVVHNAAFNQTLLRAPGVAEDSFGQLHVRGEHANLQYRINDVLIPEGITGFGQELDTRMLSSVSLIASISIELDGCLIRYRSKFKSSRLNHWVIPAKAGTSVD